MDQEKEYPFLKAEKEVIRQALETDKPYLGFCLGHQLLAHALGAGVGLNLCRSVGFVAGHVRKDGRSLPMFNGIPRSFPLFKWHAEKGGRVHAHLVCPQRKEDVGAFWI